MAHLVTGRCAEASVCHPVNRCFCIRVDGFWAAQGLVGQPAHPTPLVDSIASGSLTPAGQPSAVCLAAEPLGSPRICSKTEPTFAGRRRRRPPCGQLDAGCLALLGCTVQELLGHSDISTTMIY